MNEADDFMMLRNVHPHFFDNGRVGSGGLAPSEDHDYCLSVDFHTLSSPAESYSRHKDVFGLPTAGVFGVTVGEFAQHKVECRADPIPDNEAHALADFEEVKSVSISQVKKVGRKLAAIATKRGRLD